MSNKMGTNHSFMVGMFVFLSMAIVLMFMTVYHVRSNVEDRRYLELKAVVPANCEVVKVAETNSYLIKCDGEFKQIIQ